MADECCLPILVVIKLILSIGSLVIFILNIVYLFEVINNCKNEPTNFQNYINIDDLELYSNSDFCIEKANSYFDKGAFETFDLRIKKIKTFSKALVSTTLISIGLLILSLVLLILASTACKFHESFIYILSIIIMLFTFINLILNISFFIALYVHYFKSKFKDFKKFSKCKYLNDEFKNDYQFVFNVQDNFTKILILWIVSFCINIIENLIKSFSKKNQ